MTPPPPPHPHLSVRLSVRHNGFWLYSEHIYVKLSRMLFQIKAPGMEDEVFMLFILHIEERMNIRTLLMSKIYCSCWLADGSEHVKFEVWSGP